MTTPQYIVSINDRAYTSWEFHYADSHNEIIDFPEVSPAVYKLFSGDVFSIIDDKPTIVSSPVNSRYIQQSNEKQVYRVPIYGMGV